MSAPHPLDRPVWHALTTRQSALAQGGARALRLARDYGPFAATIDAAPASLQALADLLPENGSLWLVEAEAMPPPAGVTVVRRAILHQMVAAAVTPAARMFPIVPLTTNDAPAMRALAMATEPGPFFPSTHRLGDFVGVKQDGELVAMAGERMKPDGFTEVSGVCTLSGYRSRGYARALIGVTAQRILARGETPFLHVYPDNAAAIALYAALGFVLRRAMSLTVLARA